MIRSLIIQTVIFRPVCFTALESIFSLFKNDKVNAGMQELSSNGIVSRRGQ